MVRCGDRLGARLGIACAQPDSCRGSAASALVKPKTRSSDLPLSLAALGIVYGDIGTSPLYAFQSAFGASTGVSFRPDHVLGILSLIFWALVLMVSIKYVALVLRACSAHRATPWRTNRGVMA